MKNQSVILSGAANLHATSETLAPQGSALNANPGHVRLPRVGFKGAKVHSNLPVVSRGVEAMAFLGHEGIPVDAARPDQILLDLNPPKKDGRQVQEEIKETPRLKRIPVVILTTSASGEDIRQSDQFYAQTNCYISKPVDLDGESREELRQFLAFCGQVAVKR